MSMNATYSPDDNKLRLYSVSRLDAETYARVKAAGFAYAPRQQLFVAPKWTPNREDLLTELCGEIGDEDTSLVDRAEERADRFEGYQESRARDAQSAHAGVAAISQRFEFGQPILVGHHSERKARKDAERMENGMRRAVKMWDTSQYWQHRAEGALAHAKHKERPDVRARRIKTIEADKRKQERTIAEAEGYLAAWAKPLTMEQAKAIANGMFFSRKFSLADYPRNPPASQYEGDMGLWSALDGGVITVDQARELVLKAYPRTIAWANRWVAHYDNRLTYERAMLQEQGGTAADRFDLQPGGTVLVRGEWVTVIRVNKSGGKITSVTTNARFVSVRPVDEIQDYKAPSAEQAAKVKAVTKLAPLVNYEGEGFAHITQAEWNAIPSDYRGTETVKATETVGRHRVRKAMGCYVLKGETDFSKRHSYPMVFITDAKRTKPPALAEASPVVEPLPAPVRELSTQPRPVHQAPAPNEFDALREQLRAGVKVVIAPQLFPTPSDLAERMVDLAGLCEGDRILEPSAGTGRIVQALRDTGKSMHIVAVEVNQQLSNLLHANFQAKPTPEVQEVEVITGDFLAFDKLGRYDAIVMNPPFENGADIKHITHALTMLKPGGKLVAVCANGPRQNAILRPLVEARGGEWEDLPADTFKAEGTGVRTALLVMSAA